MKALLLALVALSLGACAAAPPAPAPFRSVALPSGAQGLEVRCGGLQHTFADCMNVAAVACAGPYREVSRDSYSPGSVAVPVGVTGELTVDVKIRKRTMIVQCGAAS